MKSFETTWNSSDHLEIFSRGWEPENNAPKAVVCLVHGLGEHSGRYERLAQELIKADFSLVSFDLRGHGQSAGQRGHVDSSDEFLAEIDHLLKTAQDRYPGKPCFLYGHSLGGLLVLFYVLNRKPDISGVIVTGPALRTSLEKQKLKVGLTRTLSLIMPKLSLATGLEPEDISRDPQIVEKYITDKLVHDRASLQMAKTMLNMIDYVFTHAQQFKPPLLIMHGGADRIVYPVGSVELAEKVSCDCTLKTWENFFHEIHNDPGKEQVIEFMIHWIEDHL